ERGVKKDAAAEFDYSSHQLSQNRNADALLIALIITITTNRLPITHRTSLDVTEESNVILSFDYAAIVARSSIRSPIINLIPVTNASIFLAADQVHCLSLRLFNLSRPFGVHLYPTENHVLFIHTELSQMGGQTFQTTPSRSSNPSATLAFCSAWLAAPLSRLSNAETMIACPVASSTAQPMSQNGVLATNLISGIWAPAKTRTNGAFSNAPRHAPTTSCRAPPVFSLT